MVRVRISLSKPAGCTAHQDWLTVAPGWADLLGPYKAGEIGDAEYTRRYLRLLDAKRHKILREYDELVRRWQGRDVVLLCWCGRGKFCHRRLLADWLAKNGRGPIPEL